MRLATVAIGLAGVAAHLNGLVIGALAADILFQVKRYHYSYTNDTDHTVSFYDKNGDLITQAEPGQTISFDVTPDKTTFIGGGCEGSTPGVIFSDAGPSNTPRAI